MGVGEFSMVVVSYYRVGYMKRVVGQRLSC